jgi:hypothetical protein
VEEEEEERAAAAVIGQETKRIIFPRNLKTSLASSVIVRVQKKRGASARKRDD